jgi:glutamate synthase domain-containing protein 2
MTCQGQFLSLKKYRIQEELIIFTFGKLIAVAPVLGADCVNIARGLIFLVGCIQAQVCHTNPYGVGQPIRNSTDKHKGKIVSRM